MTDRELSDVLTIGKMDKRPGGEIKLVNSSGFKNPELEKLFLKGGEDARDTWLTTKVQDIRDLLIEEVGIQRKGKDTDFLGLKELFITRLRKVIKHYEKKNDNELVGKLSYLLIELL